MGVGSTGFYEEEKSTRYVHENLPMCFTRSCNLLGSFRELISKNYDADKVVLMVINAEKQCDDFTEWQQGFTPKEHREMIDRKKMIQWQAEQKKQDRKWRIIEVVVLIIGAGLFTLLGVFIQRAS